LRNLKLNIELIQKELEKTTDKNKIDKLKERLKEYQNK